MLDLIDSFPEEMKMNKSHKADNNIRKPRKKMKKAKASVLVLLVVGVFVSGVSLVEYGKRKIEEYSVKKSEEVLMRKEQEEVIARRDRVLNNKVAYLTFDDGPNINTREVLKILERNNIKATFFLVGDMIKNNPAIVKEIYDAGHTIANHSMTHSYSYKNEDEFISELNETDKLISDAIGKEYKSLFIRVPGGSMGKSMEQNVLEKNELRSVNWTATIGDSDKSNVNVDYLLNSLNRTFGNDKYEVVLAHDIKSETAKSLQMIIDYIKEEGYIFEPLVEDSPVYFK